jgi:hypothetical protein
MKPDHCSRSLHVQEEGEEEEKTMIHNNINNNNNNNNNTLEKGPSSEATSTSSVRKFPAFYGTQGFITVFTKACYLSPP